MTSPANPTPNRLIIEIDGNATTTLKMDAGAVLYMAVPANIAKDPSIDYPQDGLALNSIISMIDKQFKTDDTVETSKLYFDEIHACYESLSMERGTEAVRAAYVFKLTFDQGWSMQPKKGFHYGLPMRTDLIDVSLTFPEIRLDLVAMQELIGKITGSELIRKTPQQLPVM